MKKYKISLFAIILTIGLLFLTGCQTQDPSCSQLPWARPPAWQAASPGIGF